MAFCIFRFKMPLKFLCPKDFSSNIFLPYPMLASSPHQPSPLVESKKMWIPLSYRITFFILHFFILHFFIQYLRVTNKMSRIDGTNFFLWNVCKFVLFQCSTSSKGSLVYYFMGPRGHKIIKGHKMDRYSITIFELSKSLQNYFLDFSVNVWYT